MKTTWSSTWKSSTQPRKQRKFAYNAPEHTRRKMLAAHLTKELAAKHGTRSIPLRVGDTVKVVRGSAKGKTAKIESIDTSSFRIQLTGMEISKRDGSKSPVFIMASNVIVMEIFGSDKRRLKNISAKNASVKSASA